MYGMNSTNSRMESLDVGTLELNHVNVQQCSVVHGVIVKKHGGMINGIDATLNVGENLPIVVVVVAIDNDVFTINSTTPFNLMFGMFSLRLDSFKFGKRKRHCCKWRHYLHASFFS